MDVSMMMLLPQVRNEPFKHYATGSEERKLLEEELRLVNSQTPHKIPLVINGERVIVYGMQSSLGL